MGEPVLPANPSDIAAFAGEWAALRECASPWRSAERLRESFRGVDWPRLLVLAEEHGVIGHLAACLQEDEAPGAPAEIKQELAKRQRALNFLTLQLTAELLRLLEVFAAEGISLLVTKGPVLAARAYDDPAKRSYGDLDLLIRQGEIRHATEALTASGYQAAVTLAAIDAGKIPGQYLFTRADSKLLVELHNDATLRYFPRLLPIEDVFARQARVRVDAHEVPAASAEDELVMACVHGAKHFWERLSLIADVAGLLARQRNLDWKRATESARAVEAEHLLHSGLRLASELLGAELPGAIAGRVHEDAAAAKMVARVLRWLPAAGYAPPGLIERALFRLRMRGRFLSAPAYLLRLLLSPTEEDWQARGEVSASPWLDVLRRPFRLARKYGRGGRN
jgi:hypothetical protein